METEVRFNKIRKTKSVRDNNEIQRSYAFAKILGGCATLKNFIFNNWMVGPSSDVVRDVHIVYLTLKKYAAARGQLTSGAYG